MRFQLRTALTLALTVALPVSAVAQERVPSPGTTLSLDEAVALAVRHNPDHLQMVNNRQVAGAAVRSAYGGYLPTADFSLSSSYRKQGVQPIGGVTFGTSADVYQSSYSLGLAYRLNRNTFLNPRLQNANLQAVDADITGSAHNVRSLVTQQYLDVLQAGAQAALQDSLVLSAEQQLELANARVAVGSATSLDLSRAEVELGTQRVAALRARANVEIQTLRLFQRMGLPYQEGVRLTTELPTIESIPELGALVSMARQDNPTVRALRSRDRAAAVGVSTARSEYLPTLSLSTGWGGYTYQSSNIDGQINQARSGIVAQRAQCFTMDSIRTGSGLGSIAGQCSGLAFTDEQAALMRSQNDRFPFDFTRNPLQVSATVSLPIFNGFSREQRVQESEANRADSRHRVRAAELQVEAEVATAYLNLRTARRAMELQEVNAARAAEELQLAEARFRVGASSFLDVTQSRASYERAATDRIAARYDYHKALAALESAVGHPLR